MEGHCQYAVLPLKPSLLQFEKTAPFISEKCCTLAEKAGFLFCGKATAVATCRRHIAKSRLSNPAFRENKKTVLSDGPLIWRRRWDSFSAEKPRRLQCATGTLPRAAFRIPPSNEKSRPNGRLNFGGEGGIPFLRKSHGGCNVPPAHCQEPPFESHLQGKPKDRPFGRSSHLAEKVGFEPTWRVTANSISSRARYDHFDTSP